MALRGLVDLDGDESAVDLDDEVDLVAAAVSPVVEPVGAADPLELGGDLVDDEGFE